MNVIFMPRSAAVLLLLCFMSTTAFAQSKIKDGSVVGSSSLPDTNAILELESSGKGFLLPRVALSNTTLAAPLGAHVAGISVYNTVTAGDVTPGYYFNNGAKWVRVADATAADLSKDAWVDDNANTMVKLGTQSDGSTARTTGTEVVIKDNGRVGIGTANPSVPLEVSNSAAPGLFSTAANFLHPANNVSGNSSQLQLGTTASTRNAAQLRFFYQNAASDSNRFDVGFNGLSAPRMSVLAGGNVGIGTAVPSATLEVNGTVEIQTVDNVPDTVVYRDLIWNTATHRVETAVNSSNVLKTVSAVASGDTASVYTITVSGSGAYDIDIYTEDGCGASCYNKFIATGSNSNGTWTIKHVAGMSSEGDATPTRITNKIIAVDNPVAGCSDGSNTTAFDFTLIIIGGTGELQIVNNGNIARSYRFSIRKAFN